MKGLGQFWLLFAVMAQMLFASVALADPVMLPSDVAVTLAVTATSNLAPGDSIAFTMTVTNNGPASLGYVAFVAPQISTQFYFPSGNWNDCNLITVTGEGTNGPFWYLEWFPSGFVGENPIAAGETRICHFMLTITPTAPLAFAFTVGLGTNWTDPNPANNSASVLLQQPIDPIPTLSPAMLLLLAGMLALATWQRSSRITVPNWPKAR